MTVKISFEVEPELRRRVKIAAVSRDQSVKDWIQHAILRELEDSEGVELAVPPEGVKPRGGTNPPRPRSGQTVADAVIEDRR